MSATLPAVWHYSHVILYPLLSYK